MSRSIYGKNQYAMDRLRNKESSSIIFWLSILFVVFFLLVASFQTALFNGEANRVYTINSFERPIFSAILWSSILMILIAIHFFNNWTLKNRADLLALGVWLIPVTFILSSFSAASAHLSTKMILLQIMYSTFFTLGIYLNKNKLGTTILVVGFMLCGYSIVLYGFLNLFGNAYSTDGVMLKDQLLRLTSVFQYPNAYAAFLIALLIGCLHLLIRSRKWYAITLHSFFLVPIIVSFLLTQSRGGIVLFPIILMFIFPLISLKKQLLSLAYLVLAVLVSLAVTDKLYSIGTEIVSRVLTSRSPSGDVTLLGLSDPTVLDGWKFLMLATLSVTVVLLLVHLLLANRLLNKNISWLSFRYSSFLFPIIAIILSITSYYVLTNDSLFRKLLPSTLEERIKIINFEQHSVLERVTFYKDAFKLIKDHPIIGAGGGGWAALYEKYQNNPYTSRQAHNFLLQYWIEVGTLGVVIFLIFLLYVLIQYIKSFSKEDEDSRDNKFLYYIIAISLLIHSMIDFEMSYAFIASLVFLSLGGMVSSISSEEIVLTRKPLISRLRFSYPIFLLIVAATTFIFSATQLNAINQFSTSLNNAASQKPLQDIMDPLNNALKLRPNHPDFVTTKIGFLTQLYSQNKDDSIYKEALGLIKKTKQKEANNKTLFDQELQLYSINNDKVSSLELITVGLENYPWDISLYERYATINLELSMQAIATGNQTLADQYGNRVTNVYNTVLEKVNHLKMLPEQQRQGSFFSMTPSIILSTGQIYFARKEFVAAENVLKESISGNMDDPKIQANTRWYLASIMLQGKSYPEVYNKLITKNPNERAEIDKLLKAAL